MGDVALRVLQGEPPDRIPVHQIDPNVDAFDWRELRRFGVNEARLPAGSIIQFRQPSAWDQYKWYILGATTLLVLQSALIGGLVAQGARRRRAEVAVRESASALRQSYRQNQDLAGRLINAQEEERTRIARDLYDDLSQQLASVCIMLSDLNRKWTGTAQHRRTRAAESGCSQSGIGDRTRNNTVGADSASGPGRRASGGRPAT